MSGPRVREGSIKNRGRGGWDLPQLISHGEVCRSSKSLPFAVRLPVCHLLTVLLLVSGQEAGGGGLGSRGVLGRERKTRHDDKLFNSLFGLKFGVETVFWSTR